MSFTINNFQTRIVVDSSPSSRDFLRKDPGKTSRSRLLAQNIDELNRATALTRAVVEGISVDVQLLLHAGCKVDVENHQGHTALASSIIIGMCLIAGCSRARLCVPVR